MTANPFVPTTYGLQPNAGNLGAPGAIVATSSTQQTIGLGTFTFAVQPQAAWAPGMWIALTNASNVNQWMWGIVESYDKVSELVVNVTNKQGSGTVFSWLIALAGLSGPPGPAGDTGATGAPGVNAGPIVGTAQGISVTNNSSSPDTKIHINATQAMMVNSSGLSVVKSLPDAVIDLSMGTVTSTANGMDGEAPGISAWLYLYFISDGTITAGLASLNSSETGGPTLPAGYPFYTYVGAMRLDSSGNLMRTQQYGIKTQYKVVSGTNTPLLPVLANSLAGAVGSTSTPTWVAVAWTDFIPPHAAGAAQLVLSNGAGGGVVMAAPDNTYGAAGSTTNPPPVCIVNGNADSRTFEFVNVEGSFFWATSSTNGLLQCLGWSDPSINT